MGIWWQVSMIDKKKSLEVFPDIVCGCDQYASSIANRMHNQSKWSEHFSRSLETEACVSFKKIVSISSQGKSSHKLALNASTQAKSPKKAICTSTLQRKPCVYTQCRRAPLDIFHHIPYPNHDYSCSYPSSFSSTSNAPQAQCS
jgi:hypothetical protein